MSKYSLTPRGQAIQALGDWLHRFPWEMVGTGTFNIPVNDEIRAKRNFTIFANDLKKVAVDLEYFVAVERFSIGEECHIHCLLMGVSHLKYHDVWEIWFKRYGRALFEKYDPKQGASWYIAKYVTKAVNDWDVYIKKYRHPKITMAR